MNVTVKPLVWEVMSHCHCAESPFGLITAVGDGKSGRVVVTDVADPSGRVSKKRFKSVESAKLAAERWYTAKVLDCLEPADDAASAEFATLYGRCNGEGER